LIRFGGRESGVLVANVTESLLSRGRTLFIMAKTIDYYFAPVSPYAYLGHDRFVALAEQHGANVNAMPIDLGRVFPVSGGLPLAKRAPQRQAYRLVELARWREYLNIPLNVSPKFAASGADTASKWIIAADEAGSRAALALAGAILRGRWADELDIADEPTLAEIARGVGLDAGALAERARDPAVAAKYDAFTQRAIDAGVFGVPWYVYDSEPFWGQDRLDFLARKLAK
jgi:2-hydroxychromene-2-carboxylate isomerase